MKSVHRQLNNGLAVLDVSPGYGFGPNDGFYINRILVPKKFRNKGIGTNMMNELCDRADLDKLVLLVHPTANYGSDVVRLTKFFKRFGFVFDKDHSIMMRNPK